MYIMMTVNNILTFESCLKILITRKNVNVWYHITRLTVLIILQYIKISKQYVVHVN